MHMQNGRLSRLYYAELMNANKLVSLWN